MTISMRIGIVAVAACLLVSGVRSQDSVDVTFRYVIAGKTAVSVPGEFNGWNNTAAPMVNTGGNVWTKTIRLREGGNPAPPAVGIPGAWQYKFYYAGASPWPNDPLNHHQNANDNGNSYVYVRHPTIYQFVPNQRMAVQTTATPVISAYLFPRVGAAVDTSTLSLAIDGVTHAGIGSSYDPETKLFAFTPPAPLSNGDHTAILRAGTSADTVRFTTSAGFVQITTRGGFATVRSIVAVRGLIQDTSTVNVRLVRNGIDTTTGLASGGRWVISDTLVAGANVFTAVADSAAAPVVSDPITITREVSRAPIARLSIAVGTGSVTLDAGPSSDPEGLPIAEYRWQDDPATPLGLNGQTGASVSLPAPQTPGEYYFGVIVADQEGLRDTIRAVFTVTPEQTVVVPGIAWNPAWATAGRIYFMFPKAVSQQGTLAAAATHLQRVKDLGFSVIWLMPVMKNAFPINNGTGPGYNITDFYTIAPEYGTNEDFRSFMTQAHALGLRVILDITPNHSSRSHPWAMDARTYGEDSPTWSWYEHTLIPHNTNGLGQSYDAYGFTYYSGFSDQLLNLNWNDPDLRREMIRMLSYWVKEYGVDGYRFDVYWGPHRRYGEVAMGKPVRDALKRIKPDLLLLAEDDGTGAGTEVIYADNVIGDVNGGVDAAYDFKLYFNQIRSFGWTANAITALHAEIDNGGFFPGEHALYMRFMESQDEDRIVYVYSGAFALDAPTTFRRTMPMATVLFTAPGLPMLWNGQEVGWGYGIGGAKEARARSIIDWQYQGRNVLSPHYQRLATLRGQFTAFTAPKRDTDGNGAVNAADASVFVRVPSGNDMVYAFTRPFTGQNGLTVVNMAPSEQSAVIALVNGVSVRFPDDVKSGSTVYLNDLMADSTTVTTPAGLGALSLTLPGYGSKVFTVSLTPDTLKILHPVTAVQARDAVPEAFALHPNYPNPFNPATVISFDLPAMADVSVAVFDVLGRECARLLDGVKEAGTHRLVWDATTGTGARASGVYFVRVIARGAGSVHAATHSMLFIK